MNLLKVSRIKFEFTIFISDWSRITWCFRILLWAHLMFREYTMNLLDVPRIYYELTIFIADSSRNHLMFRELTINYRLFHDFIINSIENREFIMSSFLVPEIHFISRLSTMKSLPFFANSQSFLRLNYKLTSCSRN